MKNTLRPLKRPLDYLTQTEKGRRIARGIGLAFTAGIVVYLIYQLTAIGWSAVWHALPGEPLFYIILLAMYFNLPLFEMAIFSVIWERPLWKSLSVMVRKRVYNKEVFGYSGEMYLFFWARKTLRMPERAILLSMKDNVIVSSLTSTLIAVGLLVLFLLTGQIKLPQEISRFGAVHVAAVLIGGGGLLFLGFKLRKRLLYLPGRILLALLGLHTARILVVQVLQVLQWKVLMPDVPLTSWFTLLSAQIILDRIPLLPNRGLFFLGAGIELSGTLEIASAAVAGMLLTAFVLEKILNLLFVTVFSIRKGGPDEKERPASAQAPWAEAVQRAEGPE
jgi:hypothetical protein